MQKFLKLFLEIGPLLVFFFFNTKKISFTISDVILEPIIVATIAFMIATIISLIATFSLMRKIPIMPLISGVFVIIMGALTVYLNDDLFIKLKPTIVNILFGSILLIGLRYNQVFLKIIFDGGINLTLIGWQGLTQRWGYFFFFLAGLNEFVWRFFTTDQWATFKVFGIMPITFIFVLSQVRFIHNHIQIDPTDLNSPEEK